MILYVDDEHINLKLFELMFKDKYKTVLSESPEKALDILKENNEIKVVITDMKMPVMSGVEFVEKAKTYKPELAYYLLSGYGMNEPISEALNCKLIEGYFQKPLKKGLIEKELDEHLK
ncbi:response regulator [Plebeiibacterium sediminum]|uniref:Response regulator n=1 Tax=Plebeiibacterium sediminum TaxID=2992112 RepID=A0AAE3M723_9BACT|nr:response regulator [Plebeiobacterium sediminum]MCW3788303.1 response regulator [Plebeiobacterium sediminum]